MTYKLVILFILLYSSKFRAQQPLNLGFESKSIEGASRPWGWSAVSAGRVVFTMDSLLVKEGKFSLRAECGSEEACELQFFRFYVEPFEIRGKEITLKAFTRTNELRGKVFFSLGYAYPAENDSYEEESVRSPEVSGTWGWQNHSLSCLIPGKVSSVFIDIAYSGSGTAWFDDIRLFVGELEVREVQAGPGFSAEQIEWLGKTIVSLHSAVPDTESYDDLSVFGKLCEKSTIIGLGESTHGTKEFFDLKHRLIRFAVLHMGVRIVAIEDNQLVAEKVNQYVVNGQGTAREAMSGMFAVWYTEEMFSLIGWIRSYNELYPEDPVMFAGFDMQEIKRPLEHLYLFLRQKDTVLFELARDKLADLEEGYNQSYLAGDSVKKHWVQNTRELYGILKEQSELWYERAGNAEDSVRITWAVQYANLIRQFSENLYKGHWSLYRDEAMAENIVWLREKRYPGKKLVLWAHDVHISRGDHPDREANLNSGISMGSFLSKHYRDDYKAFGLASYSGSYAAFRSYTDMTRVAAPLFPAPSGSFAEVLHQLSLSAKRAVLFLPLDRENTWLSIERPKRFANHVSIDYGFWERIALPYQFDGLFFIDETTPSVYLR